MQLCPQGVPSLLGEEWGRKVCPEPLVSPALSFLVPALWPLGLGKAPECSILKLDTRRGPYLGVLSRAGWEGPHVVRVEASVRGSMERGWVLQAPPRIRTLALAVCLSHTDTGCGFEDRAVSLGWRGWADSGTVLEME